MSMFARSAIWVAAGLCFAGNAYALAPEKIYEKLAPSVWVIWTYDAKGNGLKQGTGIVVGKGEVITNCHVLAKARRVQVKHDNVSYDASLEFPDVERDLCQLKVNNFPAPPVELGDVAQLKVGQKVYAIGTPHTLELTMSDGIISSLRPTRSGAPIIQTTAPISPGSSGGGLFDSDGRLIGITTFQAVDAQNVNFANPASWIREVPARGRAALAKYADSKGASPGQSRKTPADGKPAPSVSGYPRPVAGVEALRAHFERYPVLEFKHIHSPFTITVSADGAVSRRCPTCRVQRGDGKMTFSDDGETVCFDWYQTTYPAGGCYYVEQTGPTEFALRDGKNGPALPYSVEEPKADN